MKLVVYPPGAFFLYHVTKNYLSFFFKNSGAPGYRETPIETDFLGKQKRKTLVTIFTSMDIIMTQMDNKQQANRELLSYNKTIDILYDYKWRILTSRQKKEEQLAMRRKNMKVDVRMVLIGSSDLNASGDSAWFSDFN